MIWVPIDDGRPPAHRCVLVQVAAVPPGSDRPDSGMPATIAVGWWKYKGKGMHSYWVIPGVGTRGGVTHWADLGDDFVAPLWPGTQPGGPLDNHRNR